MHTTLIHVGFVLSAYIIVYAGYGFFGTPCILQNIVFHIHDTDEYMNS